MTDKELENKWVKEIEPILLGAKIISIQYQEEAEYWDNRPLEIILSNGSVLFAMRDDEGNDGGAYGLGWTDKAKPKTIKAIEKLGGTIPVIG
tara:strand:+ start:558 stop:833 length:276 start_codon:yes stop_codon:yes gene_type:complete